MLACRVVKYLDVFENVLPCGVTGDIRLSPDTFALRKLEEVLRDSVVMTIPTSTHAGIQIVFAEEGLALFAAELWPLIGMDHNFGFRLAPPVIAQQGLQSKVGRHA